MNFSDPVPPRPLYFGPLAARLPLSVRGEGAWPWLAWACLLVAVLPAGFVGLQVAEWIRNIPIWDEFDTVLDLLISLDSGASARLTTERLLEMNNEHRMVVSRLIFASSYWIFGGINFAVLSVIGNLFLLGTVGLLVARAGPGMPRLRLAAILGATVFQLQHHESFFWGGSSIDHFFVVLAVVAALCALPTGGRGAIAVGGLSGLLATFSLAHGLLVWPVGALLLAAGRRWRALGGWGAAAMVTVGLFFSGWEMNPGHRLPGFAEVLRVGQFWLTLVGSSPAFDQVELAPWLGAVLVGSCMVVLWRGFRSHEWMAVAVIGWCLGALAMIALGRALVADVWAPITSRYVILSSLAWALFGWILLERFLARSRLPSAWFGTVLVGLVLFNLAANDHHSAAGRVFALRSERAVQAYHRDGTFARAETPLYPDPERADALVLEAASRGLYRLPETSQLTLGEPEPVALMHAAEIGDAVYFIDTVDDAASEVRVRGWAFRPEHTTRMGDIAVVFSSPGGVLAVEATPLIRPDVALAHTRHDLNYAGFEVRLPRARLPQGELRIGICFDWDSSPEYMLTSSTLASVRN